MTTHSTDIAAFLRLLHRRGDYFEIRSPDCPDKPGGAFKATTCAYCDDADKAALTATAIDRNQPPGVYVTINPVAPALFARAANQIQFRAKHTTGDADIVRRANLLIDVDSVRPAGVSATDEEMKAALDLARNVATQLSAEGWPAPIVGVSGNGGYLIYRIDLPNDADETELCRRILLGLAERFDTTAAKIDLKTFNASRICKVLGTTARKGSDFKGAEGNPARPHRQSWFEPPAGELLPVPRELLQTVASKVTAPVTKAATAPSSNGAAHVGSGTGSGIERCRAYVAKMPDAISGQGGHSATLAAACECHRFGLSDGDALAIMQEFNSNKTGAEPWNDKELEHKLSDARKKVEAAGEIGLRLKMSSAVEEAPRRYERLTSAELDSGDFKLEYLIEHTLVAGQPAIVAGGKKTLKTNLLIDMAISLASATPFLGQLAVKRAVRVAMMSGESGLATIQETARRICKSKNLRLADISGAFWSPDLPNLADVSHEPALEQFLKEEQIEAVILDPAYLMMPGSDAGNLFTQGAMLRRLTDVCRAAGSMIILCHHTKKGVVDPLQPPELDDIAWAGFQEFARQWLLIGRRERFEPGTGAHKLWLNVGGSAGHSRLWALNIEEGVYDGCTPRRWEVAMQPAAEARQVAKLQKELEKIAKGQSSQEATVSNLKIAMSKFPNGETKTTLRDHAGLSGDRINTALGLMLRDGSAIQCDVFKTNRSTPLPGFKLNPNPPSPAARGPLGQQHPDNLSACSPPGGRTTLSIRESSQSDCGDGQPEF